MTPQFSLAEWVAEIQSTELSKIIFDGDITSTSSTREIRQKSLGLWEAEISERCLAATESDTNVNIFDVQAAETTPTIATPIEMPTFVNSEDALASMAKSYIDLLYNFKV